MTAKFPGRLILLSALALLVFAAPVQGQAPYADYGDAPDPTFPSLFASSGPRHVILTDSYVGWASTPESDALLPDADADDGAPMIFADYYAGKWTGWVYVPVTIASGADPLQPRYLNVLLDCNSSGTWCDQSGEWIVRDFPLPKYYFVHFPGQTVWYCIGGFDWVTAYSGQHWLRVTVSDMPVSGPGVGVIASTGWTGAVVPNFGLGETEDWLLTWYYNPPLPPDPEEPPPHNPEDPYPPAPIPGCGKQTTVYQTPPPTHHGHSGPFGVTVKNASADHPIHILEGPKVTGPTGDPIDIEVESLESTVIQPGGAVFTPATWDFTNPGPNGASCDFDVVVEPQGQYVVAANVGNYTTPNSTATTGGTFAEVTGVPAIGGIGLAVLVVCISGVAVYFIVRRHRATARA